MNIGERLKAKRLELKLTLEDVGNIVGVSKSTVMKWETGYIENMRSDKIELLAQALNVSPLWIMGIEETKKEAPTAMGESYTKQEKQLMLAFRAASEDDKAAVNCILRKYGNAGHKSNNDFSEEIC